MQLIDFCAEGIRPVVNSDDCGDCRQCLEVCPAVQSDFRTSGLHASGQFDDAFTKEWGPVVSIWEGYASDAEIRFKGSSGGALTAIAAYCLEKLDMHGVLHIVQDPADPIRNHTCLSRSRSELIAATGSRYSPASVCNGLGLVEKAPSPCVVIGKPAEMAAVRNAQRLRPELDVKVGVTLSFFCAESPATRGTIALLEKLGIDPGSLSDLRYRGHGWPGQFAPVRTGESKPIKLLTYRESWAFLQAYRPWSVRLWPDSTGELADLSCGDPWYEEPDGDNPGFSLVVARTERGREVIQGAIAAGYIILKPAESWKLKKSQPGLLSKKGAIWGRRLAMHLFGLPLTQFKGLNLWHCWRQISLEAELRSMLGTVRHILTRRLYRPMELNSHDGVPVNPPTIGTWSNPRLRP